MTDASAPALIAVSAVKHIEYGIVFAGACGLVLDRSVHPLGTVGKLGKADDIPKLRPLQPGEKLRLGEAARGTSDGGPGLWEKSPTRTKGQDYQEFITGMERGTEYKVNGIDFDGYDKTRNVLLDAKDWKGWPPVNKTFWHRKP